MKIGMKTLLFGVHQFILHPLFVLMAWLIIYRQWPRLHELAAIITHDWGYWGCGDLDGDEGENHPITMASWWSNRYGRFGIEVADLIAGHSRFCVKKRGFSISRLFHADKLSIGLMPAWLYWLLGTLSGELKEYMQLLDAKYSETVIQRRPTFLQWFLEVRSHCTLMGLFNEEEWKERVAGIKNENESTIVFASCEVTQNSEYGVECRREDRRDELHSI